MNHSLKIISALGLIYLIWGSSYLAIHIGVQEIQPLLFCSIRFLCAAPLMFCFALWCRESLPSSRKQWLVIIVSAISMQVLSSGLVAWGQQWVPSNQTALIFCSAALWLAWFGSLGKNSEAINGFVWLGITIGLLGIILVIQADFISGQVPLLAYGAIFLSAINWSLGSIFLRRYSTSSDAMMVASLHLLIAGSVFGIASMLLEESVINVWSFTSIAALLYLTLFASFIAYAAYYWLIHAAPPVLLGTFAYVTPAIAVLLGALILNESLSFQQIIGSVITLFSVIIVIVYGQQSKIKSINNTINVEVENRYE